MKILKKKNCIICQKKFLKRYESIKNLVKKICVGKWTMELLILMIIYKNKYLNNNLIFKIRHYLMCKNLLKKILK